MRPDQLADFHKDQQNDHLRCVTCAGLGALALVGCLTLLYWAREVINSGWGV